jgi:hypothetical protein
MQYFGQVGLDPGPLSSRQDNNRQIQLFAPGIDSKNDQDKPRTNQCKARLDRPVRSVLFLE